MGTLIIFTILFTNLFINSVPATGVSTIKVCDQLNSTSQLVSPGSIFTLGFFIISETNYTYLGIWYTNDDQSTKVWVANSSTPITSSSHVLMIHPNTGKLIIARGDTTLVNISDNQFTPGATLTATLEDTGNLKLKNEIDNRTLWQSFDHPTNVLLPGMKLGVNLKTGQNWKLTSWLGDDSFRQKYVFTPGSFTLSWEPTDEASQRFIIRRRGQPYWTSGNLNNQTFPNIMLNSSFHMYKPSHVYNNEERYFNFGVVSGARPMWILTPDGMLLDGDEITYITHVQGDEFCYGYETSSGCLAEPSLLHGCRSKTDKFSLLNGDYPMDGKVKELNSHAANSSLSRSDCMMRCWNDCRCLAFEKYTYGSFCTIYTGPKSSKFTINPQGNSVPKYVLEFQNPRKETKHIWAPIVAGVFLLSLSLGLLWFLKRRNLRLKVEERQRRDDEYFLGLMASDSFNSATNLQGSGRKISDVMVFSYASIVISTNGFASENKLGQGGFGPVYKGKFSDGQNIAIKRLSKASGQGLMEFKNELILITKIQHKNLVRILGCCIQGEEKMLIYEYMPNKSLDFFLFDESRKTLLDWPTRWTIIEGIAQGMLYLHKYSTVRVVHRDLKASNVLLDESMNPKISDFGLARIFKQHETEATTKRVVGTYGYMAPEYSMEGTFSVKSDVFSFGVLTLEIVSGRRNTSFSYRDKTVNLIGYAWELWVAGDAMELEDPTLANTHVIHQLLRTIHVALLCIQEKALDRPSMSDVLSMLNNDTMALPIPNRPAYFIGRSPSKSNPDERKPNECSVNKMTVTLMEAR